MIPPRGGCGSGGRFLRTWFVERALFKRGCVRIVGEHATAKSPREKVLAFSNPRGPLAVTSTPGTGPLKCRCFMPSFLLWLSPPATDPISKLAKPLLPLQLSLVPSEAPPLFALLFYLLLPPSCSPPPLPPPPPCRHCLTTSRCLRRQLFPTSADNKSLS
jgi:hypothetical protein